MLSFDDLLGAEEVTFYYFARIDTKLLVYCLGRSRISLEVELLRLVC
jgi:hypothetical protein